MKLKEYAKLINLLAVRYPNAKVVYSIDSEGNAYEEVCYAPTEGHYSNNEFDTEKETNAVCIN